MPYITTADGTDLHYHDWGTGTPVILIHGWPVNSDMWEHQADALVQNGYRVIAYDRRGFGKSTKAVTGHDYNTLSDDLAEIINQLNLHNAALVGFSMGGGEVVRYLSRHGSARISKAVLIASVAPYMLKTDSNPDGTPEATFDDFYKNLQKDRFDFLQTFGQQFYGRSAIHHTVSQGVLDWTFSMAVQANLRATLEELKSFSTTDFRAEMKSLTTPVPRHPRHRRQDRSHRCRRPRRREDPAERQTHRVRRRTPRPLHDRARPPQRRSDPLPRRRPQHRTKDGAALTWPCTTDGGASGVAVCLYCRRSSAARRFPCRRFNLAAAAA